MPPTAKRFVKDENAARSMPHRLFPSGGVLQLSAMICASSSPVIFGGLGGVRRIFSFQRSLHSLLGESFSHEMNGVGVYVQALGYFYV
ncbi:hypothetical protein [Paenibacillus glufosinatiresistens]|uniref:hypothetical protein n=1 Tax=Paenibacillus glufosinatiresistens TaxID=3070657 RepID=UPI00286E9768|nr:hypothetical protein [Paenibacillus sp. YX.27]